MSEGNLIHPHCRKTTSQNKNM